MGKPQPQLDLFAAFVVEPTARASRAPELDTDKRPPNTRSRAANPGRPVPHSLPGAPALVPSPAAKPGTDVEGCMLGHGPEYICRACGSGGTDGCGFLHRSVCGGRIPLRACRGCGKLKTHGGWNHADYWRCLECVPLGTVKKP